MLESEAPVTELADAAYEPVGRTGETLRQSEWREALWRSGVRAKDGKRLRFSRVEPLLGARHIQAEAETVWAENGKGGGGGGGEYSSACRLAAAESAGSLRSGACPS